MASKKERRAAEKKLRLEREYEHNAAQFFNRNRGYFVGDPITFVRDAKLNAAKVIDLEARAVQIPFLVDKIARQEETIWNLQGLIASIQAAEEKDEFVEQEKRKLVIRRKLALIEDEKLAGGDDEDDESLCAVCSDSKKIIALLPCGHKQLCGRCTLNTVHERNCCPLCNATIVDVVRVFD